MKTIGLLGGMSWESTVPYYKTINRIVGERLGGHHSAKIILHSIDFFEIEQCQNVGEWARAGVILSDAARMIEDSGADVLLICSNTMHKVAHQVESTVSIPLLHIADATAAEIKRAGLRRVGLLGTRFTMEQGFYRGHLEEHYGLTLVVPPQDDREQVHRIIYDELCHGKTNESSRSIYRSVVADLVVRGCEGIILGCTEIGMLLQAADATVPLLDTARIHAEAAASWALA